MNVPIITLLYQSMYVASSKNLIIQIIFQMVTLIHNITLRPILKYIHVVLRHTIKCKREGNVDKFDDQNCIAVSSYICT